MAPKGKQPAAATAPADLKARGKKLLNSYVGVPTTFFGVETGGERYLGKVTPCFLPNPTTGPPPAAEEKNARFLRRF